MEKENNISTHILERIEQELGGFNKLLSDIDSLIKWEIINLFYRNPNTYGTCYELAQYIGRNVEQIEKEIEDLVRAEILINCGEIWGKVPYENYTQFYRLTNDVEIRDLIRKLILFAQKHSNRFEKILFSSLSFNLKQWIENFVGKEEI